MIYCINDNLLCNEINKFISIFLIRRTVASQSYFTRVRRRNVSLDDVTVTAAGGNVSYGIYNFGSSPRMTNVTATGTGGTDGYGVYQQGGSVLIRDSFLTGSTFSVRKVSGTIRILNTVFNGNTAGVGAAACIAALTTQLTDFICL